MKCNTGTGKGDITFEEFRDGLVLRDGTRIQKDNDYYTKAVQEEQININDSKEVAFSDGTAFDPYEIKYAKEFLCSSGVVPCDKSFAGALGNEFKSTGIWMENCPVFHQ